MTSGVAPRVGSLGRSLYRRLRRYALEVDGDPHLRNLLLDCGVELSPDTGEWRTTGTRSIPAECVRDGSPLADRVSAEFRKIDPLPMSSAFKQLAFLTAASQLRRDLNLEAAAAAQPLPPRQRLAALPPDAPLPGAFLLLSHPLSKWCDALNSQSVTLVFSAPTGGFKGITLNFPYSFVGDLPLERTSPYFSRLKDCPVRIGGFVKDDGILPLVCLHTMEEVEGSLEILPGLYSTGDLDAVIASRKSLAEDEYRLAFFMGHQEWSQHHVSGMISNGHAVAAELPHGFCIFSLLGSTVESPTTLGKNTAVKYQEYRQACLRLGPPYQNWALFPPKDSLPEGRVLDYLDKISCL